MDSYECHSMESQHIYNTLNQYCGAINVLTHQKINIYKSCKSIKYSSMVNCQINYFFLFKIEEYLLYCIDYVNF